jgi:Membrane domain of glycerophosphoryl diester phosphodiesterase/Uncharacterised protein family (UPF0259)
MSLASASSSKARLDIGGALQDLINAVARNIILFTILGVVLAGAPSVLVDVGRALAPRNGGYVILAVLGGAASLVTRPILAGAIIFGTLRTMDGERVSLTDCLAAGRRRWGTMLGLMILSGLGVVVGLILLVAPGVYLAIRWALAGPAVVVSGRGISDSMDRSASLTAGRMWGMFLFYLILFVVLVLVVALLDGAENLLVSVAPRLLLAALIDPLTNVITDVGFAAASAILFRRLRVDTEGPAREALAEVFA